MESGIATEIALTKFFEAQESLDSILAWTRPEKLTADLVNLFNSGNLKADNLELLIEQLRISARLGDYLTIWESDRLPEGFRQMVVRIINQTE